MDDERRAALQVRRAARKRAAEDAEARRELEPVLDVLDAAGASYRLRKAGGPQPSGPSWLAEASGAIPWERQTPDVWETFSRDAEGMRARAEAAASLLARLVLPDVEIEVVFAGCALSLSLRADLAGRHCGALGAVATSAAWLFRPGAEWLIELGRDGRLIARLG